jgi:Protein of unknown function (DUF2887)
MSLCQPFQESEIYLNELTEETSLSLGILKLVVEPGLTAREQARRLLEQAHAESVKTVRRDYDGAHRDGSFLKIFEYQPGGTASDVYDNRR